MTLFNVLVSSSALALSVLVGSAAPANALVAHNDLAARHEHTPHNHNGMLRRKRANRKRCVQLPVGGGSATSNPGSSASQDAGSSTYTPPVVSNPPVYGGGSTAPACSNGGKVGLAWGPTMPSNYIPNATTGKTCWYYNWSAWAADSAYTGGLKFIPMLWGPKDDSISAFYTRVVADGTTNYGIALGMNEVNQDGQAYMSVDSAVSMWNQYMAPLKNKGYYLISPSTTSVDTGIDWMHEFLGRGDLQGRPDAIATHWYGDSFDSFKAWVDKVANEFKGMPIYITEFACSTFPDNSCPQGTASFASQATAYLNAKNEVAAYFPFAFDGTMSNVGEASRLMTTWGEVTPLGWQYIS